MDREESVKLKAKTDQISVDLQTGVSRAPDKGRARVGGGDSEIFFLILNETYVVTLVRTVSVLMMGHNIDFK